MSNLLKIIAVLIATVAMIGCNNATDSSMGVVSMGEHPEELVGVWNSPNWELTLNKDGLYYKKTGTIFQSYVESGTWYENGAQIVFNGEIDYGGETVNTKYAAYYEIKSSGSLGLCKVNVGNTNIWDCTTYNKSE